MSSRNTYHPFWVSLTLDVGYLFTCSSKAQPLLLSLDEGYLLTAPPPDLERGVAPLGPPALLTALSNSMKLSHALWGNPRQAGHGGEV